MTLSGAIALLLLMLQWLLLPWLFLPLLFASSVVVGVAISMYLKVVQHNVIEPAGIMVGAEAEQVQPEVAEQREQQQVQAIHGAARAAPGPRAAGLTLFFQTLNRASSRPPAHRPD